MQRKRREMEDVRGEKAFPDSLKENFQIKQKMDKVKE